MKYLLDTHILLWFFHNDPKLPERTKDIICSNVEVSVSIASFWEIAIKKSIGKLDILESVSYLERLSVLPFIHGDPFDRLIIATAVEEALTLITHDEKIQKYSLNILLHHPQKRLAHRIHENTPFHAKSTSPSRLMPSLNLTTNLPQNRSYPSGFMYKRGYGFLCSSQSVRLNPRNPIRS